MKLELGRIDPEHNMQRFCLMQLQLDLFGAVSLIRKWGRIGSGGRTLVDHHTDEGAAITLLLNIAGAKAHRGYADRA